MDMQTMYASMDVSHLSVDEVEYELLIRNILFHFDDHESIKRRKLRDKLKTKGADKFRNEIVKVGRQATELFGRFFPEVNEAGAHSEDSERLETDLNNVLEEVRSEIEVLNETTASGKEIEEELEQAAATSQVLELKKKEMNDSLKRAEDILKVLSEYEEGKKENPMELIAIFKTFVRQTTEQQRQMREKQIVEEERKMKEAKDSMERKKRLEKVLISLNDRLKKEPDGSDEKSPTKSIEQEKPKVQLEDRKQGEKMISFKHDSDDCGQDSSDESREKSKHRKERKSIKKGNSSSKRGKKKRHRKPSYSSTSSTTSVTESSEFSSSRSSSGSELAEVLTDQNAWYADLFKKVESSPEAFLDYKIENQQLLKLVPNKTEVLDYRHEWKLCIPESDRERILQQEHDESLHIGYDKLLDKLRSRYFWPKMAECAKKRILLSD
ncbi:pre-mRNA-splicing factor SLU7-like [Aedes albopictus]|uniref:Integrase zinc-binding domain-containing protein n=1 Tax=Aedes albopictus TaxID=7160 RepID=A0ABM1ZJE9_AEDAL